MNDGSELPEGGNDIQLDRQVEEGSEGADGMEAEVPHMGIKDPIRASIL